MKFHHRAREFALLLLVALSSCEMGELQQIVPQSYGAVYGAPTVPYPSAPPSSGGYIRLPPGAVHECILRDGRVALVPRYETCEQHGLLDPRRGVPPWATERRAIQEPAPVPPQSTEPSGSADSARTSGTSFEQRYTGPVATGTGVGEPPGEEVPSVGAPPVPQGDPAVSGGSNTTIPAPAPIQRPSRHRTLAHVEPAGPATSNSNPEPLPPLRVPINHCGGPSTAGISASCVSRCSQDFVTCDDRCGRLPSESAQERCTGHCNDRVGICQEACPCTRSRW